MGTRADASPGMVTHLLRAWSDGATNAQDELLALVYNELRRRASAHLRGERKDHTLQPTALVHETYLRLLVSDVWTGRVARTSSRSPRG